MEKRREKYKISKERRELIFQKECKVKSYISNANKTLNQKRKKRKSVINEWDKVLLSIILSIFFFLSSCRQTLRIISYRRLVYHIISYHIISQHIISHHITAYHIISYHITSYHIISRQSIVLTFICLSVFMQYSHFINDPVGNLYWDPITCFTGRPFFSSRLKANWV